MRVTKDTVPDIATFYKKYRPLVNTLLLNLGASQEELDDCFQDVIERMIETDYLAKYGNVEIGEYCSSFKYYIFRLVRSVYLNKKRKGFKRELLDFNGKKKVWSEYKQIDSVPLEALAVDAEDDKRVKEIQLMSPIDLNRKDLEIIIDQFKAELHKEGPISLDNLNYVGLWQYVYEGYTLVEVARLHNISGNNIYIHYKNLRKMFSKFIQNKGLNATLLLGH